MINNTQNFNKMFKINKYVKSPFNIKPKTKNFPAPNHLKKYFKCVEVIVPWVGKDSNNKWYITGYKSVYQLFSKIDDALLYQSESKLMYDNFVLTTNLR